MKKNEPLKVGLYDPYLDTMGGGEKHILSILQVFAEQEAEITIFWDKNLSKEIENRFSLQCFKTLKWQSWQSRDLKKFNYFFYVTDGSYFFSLAKKNLIFCMVPNKKLYDLNLLNRLKLWNYKFISNSPYTTKWLTKWGIDSITIPPYIDDRLFLGKKIKKEKVILSVGRFFSHLHSKNQEKIIQSFKRLKSNSKSFSDYKLVLAGGLKKEDQSYFNQLKLFSKNDPSIIFKPNVSLYELYKLYKLSNYFWHFTGLGIDEQNHPEQVEHFGIAPLEAAASGALVFCHNSGGPRIIFTDGVNGLLFDDEDGLVKKMLLLEKYPELTTKIRQGEKQLVKKQYNYEQFKNKVLKLI